jgi:hypothetical protein
VPVASAVAVVVACGSWPAVAASPFDASVGACVSEALVALLLDEALLASSFFAPFLESLLALPVLAAVLVPELLAALGGGALGAGGGVDGAGGGSVGAVLSISCENGVSDGRPCTAAGGRAKDALALGGAALAVDATFGTRVTSIGNLTAPGLQATGHPGVCR